MLRNHFHLMQGALFRLVRQTQGSFVTKLAEQQFPRVLHILASTLELEIASIYSYGIVAPFAVAQSRNTKEVVK
jgi:hypothetical protein